MKIFRYKKSRYLFSAKIPAAVMIIVALYSVLMISANRNNIFYYIIFICAILVFSNFVFAIAYPESIILDDEYIEFRAFGRKHKYMLNKINVFTIKDINPNIRIYLRISCPGQKGRYWIDFTMFSDGSELYLKLKEIKDSKLPQNNA